MKMQNFKTITALLAAGLCAGAGTTALASITFSGAGTGSDGSALAASAIFDTDSGGHLKITIVNTATTPTTDAANVLTALFFQGAVGVTGVHTEYIPARSSVFHNADSLQLLLADTPLPTTFFGTSAEQWQYKVVSPTDGLGAAGLGFFNGNQVSKDGLVSPNYVPIDGLKHDGDVIFMNSIVILLSGFTGSLSDISNVRFQYGTSSPGDPTFNGDPAFTAVPEPTTMIAGALLLLPFGASTICERRSKTVAGGGPIVWHPWG
jgi:hypothetical protein